MDDVVSIAKLLLMLLAVTTIGYVSLLGVTYISQRALLYPGAQQARGHASWGETVYIMTPDGERLFGLYSRGEPRKPAVLFFLGNADRIDNYSFLAQALASRGIGLLAISYRGYPGSTGTPSEVGLLTDGVAAFDWLAADLKARSLCSASLWEAASPSILRGADRLSPSFSFLATCRCYRSLRRFTPTSRLHSLSRIRSAPT